MSFLMYSKEEIDLVAPCGMNCGICKAYLAYSRDIPKKPGKVRHCPGCRQLPKTCSYLKGSCTKIRNNKITYCFECKDFPCHKVSTIDKRYRTNYDTSFIENLKCIEKKGIQAFLKEQAEKYRCPLCGGTISVHDGKCYDCLKNKIRH